MNNLGINVEYKVIKRLTSYENDYQLHFIFTKIPDIFLNSIMDDRRKQGFMLLNPNEEIVYFHYNSTTDVYVAYDNTSKGYNKMEYDAEGRLTLVFQSTAKYGVMNNFFNGTHRECITALDKIIDTLSQLKEIYIGD